MNFPSISTFLLVLITITACHQAHAEAPKAAPGPSTSTSASASATGPTMTKPELLAKACDTTPLTKDLCRSFLASFPESEVKDIHGLAKFAIKMTSLNASKTHEMIDTMEHTAADDVTKQRLNDCAENYHDAIDQLEDSMPALDAKAFDDVITFITAAVQDVESCEDGFKEPPAVKSPMTQTNEVFIQLCNICLAITNMDGK